MTPADRRLEPPANDLALGAGAPGEGRGVGARERAVVVTAAGSALPPLVAAWLERIGVAIESVPDEAAMMAQTLRARPQVVVIDGRSGALGAALSSVARLKRDSFTGIVPALVAVDDAAGAAAALRAGADEALHAGHDADEARARLNAMLRRAERDTGVHPTTRLPGTVEIEAELDRRIARRETFATCYADLDHFKEYNDRYGYNEGDRVIRMLALVLHDVVKGVSAERGFVGHIGGDDFICIVPLDDMVEVCATIVETFDALVPFQYSEADRRAGYYFGKDRRGKLHRVPLMSVSIGVVTTERRSFTRASQVSALASEMKSYAKAQPGSGYFVDRRQDSATPPERATLHPSEPDS